MAREGVLLCASFAFLASLRFNRVGGGTFNVELSTGWEVFSTSLLLYFPTFRLSPFAFRLPSHVDGVSRSAVACAKLGWPDFPAVQRRGEVAISDSAESRAREYRRQVLWLAIWFVMIAGGR